MDFFETRMREMRQVICSGIIAGIIAIGGWMFLWHFWPEMNIGIRTVIALIGYFIIYLTLLGIMLGDQELK